MMRDGRAHEPGTIREILIVFVRLGLTSFGGPVAHLGYFRDEFVQRRGWIGDAAYADLVALCQFLPGPASSQTGFAIGLLRGGWRGGLAAWAGFTLPSALLMLLFAYGAPALGAGFGGGVIAGLKVFAVAIVAQAVFGMGRSLCPDAPRITIMLAAMALLALWPDPRAQLAAIAFGALSGLLLPQVAGPDGTPPAPERWRRPSGLPALGVFAALFVLVPLLVQAGLGGHTLALFDAFFRAGALVFGGGHVVLPLLEGAVVTPGWVSPEAFLAGYGAAQAVPGPLFTFAAYLGAVAGPEPSGAAGGLIALAAISLPGLLLVAGMMPCWEGVRRRPRARAALAGVNAAVVGVLAQALYDPVFLKGIHGPGDLTLAAAAFLAITVLRVPVWSAVIALALAGGLRGGFGL